MPDEDAPPALTMDSHEPDEVAEGLEALGVPVERRKIHPGDYVVGDVGVERKSVRDFHGSLVSQRLFEQVTRLAASYPKPLLLLEGDLARIDDYRNPDAVRGALLSLTVDYGVPLVPTRSREDTARMLAVLWRRVARGRSGGGPVRHKPRRVAPADEQKFAVQGLPGVGDVTSERLLERFGTVRRVFAASEGELKRVPLLGPERAHRISEFLDRPFEGPQRRLE